MVALRSPKRRKPMPCDAYKIGSIPPIGRLNDVGTNKLRWRSPLRFATESFPTRFPHPINYHEYRIEEMTWPRTIAKSRKRTTVSAPVVVTLVANCAASRSCKLWRSLEQLKKTGPEFSLGRFFVLDLARSRWDSDAIDDLWRLLAVMMMATAAIATVSAVSTRAVAAVARTDRDAKPRASVVETG